MKNRILVIFAICICISLKAYSQKDYQPAPENLAARQWFQDAKFGLFIHWGVYSTLANGEWVMNQQQFDKATYEKLPAFFNPVDFNAAEWVKMVKDAGMQYITITSKHHDGFAMWDTKLSDWNIVDRTPYGKDVLKQLADECHKQGVKLFFYHSHLDWYQENYYPRGGTGSYSGRPNKGDWNAYLDYMDGQLTELLTNYGEIAGIWFDGWWDKKDANWRLDKTYSLIHKLQPAALIGNNHHQAPKPGEDFQMFEKDLPGHNTTGFSDESKVGALPLETCETMNGAWGFNIRDKNFKSTAQLVQYLVKAAGYNANFLLNVGPMPNGKIQPEFVKTLGEMGEWMKKYGETIYGTRGGPVSPHPWGVTTTKGNKVFVHLIGESDDNLLLNDFGKKIKKAYLFDDQSPVIYKQTEFGIAIKVPAEKRKPIDTIVVLEF
ncbi:MAG: alpha-L-fucosidase [Bacteroidia bacterium]|nr:alpha-L-fucosidase [Bacteroidia bacterium]